MEDILVNCNPEETRVAVLVDGILEDLHIERDCSRGLVGNIYLGRVVRVLPGMQSAFIDVGLERTAFLHVLDIESAHIGPGQVAPIEKVLCEGQNIMVQVAKDPIGTKGARLTTAISLAGRKLVYLPGDSHIGVSQKIEEPELREKLRALVDELRPQGSHGGYIVRTCAEEECCREDFLADMQYLGRVWAEVRERATKSQAPALLCEDLSLPVRVLRDMVQATTERIIVDDNRTFRHMMDFARRFVPDAVPIIENYQGERPLFELFGIDEEIQKALGRRVDLKSGGYLVIDQTEAMTTIDVNTGAFVGKRDFSDTVFKTNLEAAQTIARQLRLRNLGGIIIIDFIDMVSDAHRAAVLAELRRAVASDRTRLTVSDFTELGLVEMTRKRTRESLAHVLCEQCPVCGGRGEIKTARTVAYEILREIVREWRQYRDAQAFKILASQSVIDLFLEEESQTLDDLQNQIRKPVYLEVEPSYTQEQYDVILS